eukprot:TRINITY_DN57031_c0_g1_i1.p1 TRINITY_DN57031_c0_g1~~TRINITY_DN57031_c0_g1_i1.p1  ORF type:complete len:106 (+),score=28.62 TRINITY_DN57031_c0_g1_i1:48-320(+)
MLRSLVGSEMCIRDSIGARDPSRAGGPYFYNRDLTVMTEQPRLPDTLSPGDLLLEFRTHAWQGRLSKEAFKKVLTRIMRLAPSSLSLIHI